MIRAFIVLLACVTLSGCASYKLANDIREQAGPARLQDSPEQIRLDAVPELDGPKITIAVYSFTDKTGQRKPNEKFSQLSSAITQGSEVWVIQALKM